MTTPTLTALESLFETMTKQHTWITNVAAARLVQVEIDRVKAALAAQPELPEPVGAQCGFIGHAWAGCSIEHHEYVQANPDEYRGYQTRLVYTAAQLQQAQAKREPMTDAQIDLLQKEHNARYHNGDVRPRSFARAIEAHHHIGEGQ